MERILREKEVLEIFFKHTLSCLVLLDKNYNFIRVNEVYAKACNRDASEFPGKNHFDLYPSDAKEIFDRVVQTKVPYQTFSRPFVFPDHPEWGVTYWDWTLVPVLDGAGEVEMLVFSLIDVTERQKAEEKLKHYASELQRSNKELDDFASIASHDLQEPLRKIVSFGNLLWTKRSVAIDEQAQDCLNRMHDAAERMQSYLNDLLKFSRIASKPHPFEATGLEQVVREALSDLELRVEKSGACVNVNALPMIDANKFLMRQLFQNLISNAIKFHRKDAAPVVVVNSRPLDNDFWEISVEDNGIGFDEKHAERIFLPFERLNERSKYEGTGMGLAICKKIVGHHQGTITARSSKGNGSIFLVVLPARQPMKA